MAVTAQGYNGQIRVEGDWLVIERSGVKGRLTQGWGDKRLRLDQITGIKLKPAGPLRNGFIHFATPGRDNVETIGDAGKDDNSVVFLKRHQREFEDLRSFIEQHAR